jgi:hypothetical protein
MPVYKAVNTRDPSATFDPLYGYKVQTGVALPTAAITANPNQSKTAATRPNAITATVTAAAAATKPAAATASGAAKLKVPAAVAAAAAGAAVVAGAATGGSMRGESAGPDSVHPFTGYTGGGGRVKASRGAAGVATVVQRATPGSTAYRLPQSGK